MTTLNGMPGIETTEFLVSKIDDETVAFETNFVEALFPYSLSCVMMVSPCRARELNYDWAQYALHPSGTELRL